MSDIMLSSPHFETVGRTDWWMPRGALVAASELQRNGFSIRLVDMDLLGETDEERQENIREIIREEGPERLFLSVHGLFAVARFAYLLDIEEIRGRGIKIIAGGPLPTVENEYLERFLSPDQIVVGQVDGTTIGRLVEAIRNGEKRIDLNAYSSVGFSYHLDFDMYGKLLFEAGKKASTVNVHMETVRSCPFHCDFCSIPPQYPFLGRRMGLRDMEGINAELDFLSSLGITDSLGISDPTFGASWKHAETVMQLLREYGFQWGVMSRASVLDESRLQIMRRCGCNSIAIGVETADEGILEEVHKNAKPEENARAIRWIREAGISPIALVILGMSQKDDFGKMTAFLHENKMEQVVATEYHPTPGSPSFEENMRKARVECVRDLEDFDFLGLPVLDFQDVEKLEAQRLAIRIAFANPYDPIYRPQKNLGQSIAEGGFDYVWAERLLVMRFGRNVYVVHPPEQYGEFKPEALSWSDDAEGLAREAIAELKSSEGIRQEFAAIRSKAGPVQSIADKIRRELLAEGKKDEFQKKLRKRANCESPALRRMLLYPHG